MSGGEATDTQATKGSINLYEGGRINGLTAQESLLNVMGNANMTGLASFDKSSLVKMTDNKAGNTLSMQNLKADGTTFEMDVDLEAQTADLLQINGQYEGNGILSLTNVAQTAQSTDETGIKLVEFANDTDALGTFELKGGQWDEGGYIYKLEQGDLSGAGKDYYLTNTRQYSDTFKGMLNLPLMNVMLARTGMNSLQTRLGDLHNMGNQEKKQGIWVRSLYKDMTVKDLVDTDLKLFGAEAGYDWLFLADEPTKLYAGVMLGYIQATDISTDRDSGDGTSPSVGLYATLVNDERWFVDIAARNFWTKLDMKSRTASGNELGYEPERNVITASVEVGKSILTTPRQDRFWRIEPQVELNYMNASSDSAEVKSGVGDLRYESTDYLNAKAGILIAYNARRSNGLLIEPLLELAYRYEFMGKGDVSYGGASEENDISGGIFEANVALNMQLTEDLYWYVMGGYETGRQIEGWAGNIGIRLAFGGGSEKKKPARVQRAKMVKRSTKSRKAKVEPRKKKASAELREPKVQVQRASQSQVPAEAQVQKESAPKSTVRSKAQAQRRRPQQTSRRRTVSGVKPRTGGSVKAQQPTRSNKQLSLLEQIEANRLQQK